MKLFHSKQIFSHLRIIAIIIISIFLIIYDHRFNCLKKIRSYLETYINSVYFLTNKLQETLNNIADFVSNKNQLIFENKVLKKEVFLQRARNLILEQLKDENDKLHSLLKITKNQKEEMIITKVISNINTIYHDQIIIDRGIKDGAYEGLPVINDKGIIGQIITVNKFNSRVLLICDIMHALPIKLLRNNIRGIAIGNGCNNDLKITFLTNIDVNIGDIIVTSGLGGRFPEGYQVAYVSNIDYNFKDRHSIIYAKHFVNLKNLNYLLIIKFIKNDLFDLYKILK